MAILKLHEAGVPVADLSREHNISTALIYQWRSKYGGMDRSMMRRLKELEAENSRLKKMYAVPWQRLDVLTKYQTTLDNQLYKAIKALRDEQTWRLDNLDAIDEAPPLAIGFNVSNRL